MLGVLAGVAVPGQAFRVWTTLPDRKFALGEIDGGCRTEADQPLYNRGDRRAISLKLGI